MAAASQSIADFFAGSSRGDLNWTDHRSGDVDSRGMVEMQCSFIGDVADKNTPCEQTSCPFDPEATLGPTSDEPYPMCCKSLHWQDAQWGDVTGRSSLQTVELIGAFRFFMGVGTTIIKMYDATPTFISSARSMFLFVLCM